MYKNIFHTFHWKPAIKSPVQDHKSEHNKRSLPKSRGASHCWSRTCRSKHRGLEPQLHPEWDDVDHEEREHRSRVAVNAAMSVRWRKSDRQTVWTTSRPSAVTAGLAQHLYSSSIWINYCLYDHRQITVTSQEYELHGVILPQTNTFTATKTIYLIN